MLVHDLIVDEVVDDSEAIRCWILMAVAQGHGVVMRHITGLSTGDPRVDNPIGNLKAW